MAFEFIIYFTVVVGFLMAFAIGANDVANSMGTSVGSKALTIRKAVIIAGLANLLGAILVGSHVTQTVRKGILDTSILPGYESYILGMISALLAAAIFLLVATKFSMPVSTTHSIVGALVGYGIIAAGISAVDIDTIIKIVMSWIISPISGAILAFIISILLKKAIFKSKHPVRNTEFAVPLSVFFMVEVIILVVVWKGLPGYFDFVLEEAIIIATTVGLIAGLVTWYLVKKYHIHHHLKKDHEEQIVEIERIFAYLQVFTAATVAFAHGSNDVANAIGPLSGVLSAASAMAIPENALVPLWILVLGGLGIFIGIAMFGYRVIETIGKKITLITPSKGFAVEIAAATVVLIASKMGLPVSTTHTVVGSVIGVGLASKAGINTKKITGIIGSWIFTLPIAAALTAIIYLLLSSISSLILI